MVRTTWLLQIRAWAKMTPVTDQVVAAYGRSEKVQIKNQEKTERLLSKIVGAGPKAVQVISDFDATITRYHVNGKRCESTYGLIAHSPLVSAKIKTDAIELFDKYYPIETNVQMTAEEKYPYMVEWYEKSHESFLSTHPRMKKWQMAEMAKDPNALLRENTKTLLHTLHTFKVPTLILSAGMGNLVEEILKVNEAYYSNVKVIANFMEFDDAGELKGFSSPMIHVYNKNEAALHNDNSTYFQDLSGRHNVILMGDSLGDTNMATGVKDVNALLKIGFLNSNVEEHLPKYMENYDVVLVDDQSMDFVNSIMELVTKP